MSHSGDKLWLFVSKQKTGNPDDKDESGGVEDLSRPHQFSKSPLTNHHRLLHHSNRNITNKFPTDWLLHTVPRTTNRTEIVSVCDIVNTMYNILCSALHYSFDDGKLLRENPAGGLTTATEHHDSAKKSEKGQNGKLQGHRLRHAYIYLRF